MKQGRIALVAIAIVIPLAMAGTLQTGARPEAGAPAEKVKVVTSFYPLYDFASHVAGDRAEVSSLIPPGVEPHDWEPTLGDVTRAREADLLVINGAGFESWVDGIGARAVINTSEGLELVHEEEHEDEAGHEAEDEHGHDGVDPHIWLDPVLAKHQVNVIRAALVRADPAGTGYYNENAGQFSQELDGLDSFIKEELSSCEKSDFISFHDAFSRFAERYGLVQHSIHGVSPEGEILPQKLEGTIQLANELGISVIYSEDLVDSRLADVIAAEIPGGRVLVLSPIEGIDEEELDAGIGYIEKMRENIVALKEGLQCA
ncbi:MAG TPA: zinc ABC transporter substrate-binding protein [Nitrososphaera sp.]